MAKTATLTWTIPTLRADGTALPESQIAKFDIFDAPGAPVPNPTFIAIGTVTGPFTTPTATFTTGTLLSGSQHTFMVSSTDTVGDVSAQSNLISVTVPLAGPAAIADLKVVLN